MEDIEPVFKQARDWANSLLQEWRSAFGKANEEVRTNVLQTPIDLSPPTQLKIQRGYPFRSSWHKMPG